MNIQQMLHEYNQGDRDFSEARLHGVELSSAKLSEIDLRRANLSDVNFIGAEFIIF